MLTEEKLDRLCAELCAEDIKTEDDVLFVLDKAALDPENLVPFDVVLRDRLGYYDDEVSAAKRRDPASWAHDVSDARGSVESRALKLAALRANVLSQLIPARGLGVHALRCRALCDRGVAALRALLMLERDAPPKPGPSWETEYEVWKANLADFPRAAPLPPAAVDPDVLDFGVRVVEVGEGIATLSMKIGPQDYEAKLKLPVDAEQALARHIGGLGRMTIAHDDTGPIAESLAGARSEIDRLRTLLDVVQKSTGMRCALAEIGHRRMVVCASSEHEQRIVDEMAAWSLKHGFQHPEVQERFASYARSIEMLGYVGYQLLRAVKTSRTRAAKKTLDWFERLTFNQRDGSKSTMAEHLTNLALAYESNLAEAEEQAPDGG